MPVFEGDSSDDVGVYREWYDRDYPVQAYNFNAVLFPSFNFGACEPCTMRWFEKKKGNINPIIKGWRL